MSASQAERRGFDPRLPLHPSVHMILLALEFSTPFQSAALLQDTRVLAETEQPAQRNDQGRMIAGLEFLRKKSGLEWSDVNLFAVGLGPGAYTALRMALATAHGLALPGRRPVFGLPSSDASAVQLGRTLHGSRILLCGDARRNLLWCVSYVRTTNGWTQEGDFQLLEPSSLRALVSENLLIGTPDWPHLGTVLRQTLGPQALLHEAPVYPTAATLGQVVLHKYRQGVPSLPLSPLYLHPPVRIPPTWTPPRHE